MTDEPIELFPARPTEIATEIQTTFDNTGGYATKTTPIPPENDHPESFLADLPEPEPPPPPEPAPKKQTYAQDWKAYNLAKTNEDSLFKSLLQELLSAAVEESPYCGVGRRGYTKQEKLFCMCIKVFYKSDLRKAESILKELQKLHYLNKVPSYASIDNFFNDASLSNVLDDLILISALPLANLEETGAIDATGFSVSKFQRWFDYKWGKAEGKERIWRKAHVASGCRTNTFLSVKVTESNVADAKMAEEVIGITPKYFDMKHFVADKAYLSRKIITYLANLGLEAYIPFKSNSVGKQRGCRLWKVMFEKFKNHNEEYMKKYHARSNAETGFFMVKQNYGDNLFTKNFDANVNEIKLKFLCQNIATLIQEAYESNITIDFEVCLKTINSVQK